MAISNSTSLNDLVGQIVSQDAISAAYATRVMRNIVSVYDVPLGAGSIVVPIFSGITEGSLTEGTATTSTTWNSDGLTLTPVERGIYVQISKRVLHADPFTDLAPYGEQLGRSLAAGEDTAVLAIMGSGVWSNTARGNAGQRLAASGFREAISALEAANAPKPYYCVMHPETWGNLRASFGDAATFADVGKQIVEGFGEGAPAAMSNYVGAPYGVPVFISTNVPTNVDKYNVMFSKQAVALAIMKDIGVDVFDNVTARAFDLMAWRSAHQGIVNASYGISLIDSGD